MSELEPYQIVESFDRCWAKMEKNNVFHVAVSHGEFFRVLFALGDWRWQITLFIRKRGAPIKEMVLVEPKPTAAADQLACFSQERLETRLSPTEGSAFVENEMNHWVKTWRESPEEVRALLMKSQYPLDRGISVSTMGGGLPG